MSLLSDHHFSQCQIEHVLTCIQLISFRKEISSGISGKELPWITKVVQDADRLDALGAVGIARCFTFGGTRQRALYTSPMNNRQLTETAILTNETLPNGSIYHFYEKLLKLKDMMKTNTGKKLAVRRHQVMLDFVDEFWSEVHGVST
jgi:uncharacterized protein